MLQVIPLQQDSQYFRHPYRCVTNPGQRKLIRSPALLRLDAISSVSIFTAYFDAP